MQNINVGVNSFVTNILNPIYQLAIGISIAYFLYGVAMYIYQMRDPNAITKGRDHLLYGTIGLFIMFSIGGIFEIFNTIFGSIFK